MTLHESDLIQAIRLNDVLIDEETGEFKDPLAVARFWSLVVPSSDCWEWTGSISRKGYGRFSIGHRTVRGAHRIAWMLATNEPIPDGFDVCHTCDVRNCVRNDDIGTYIVNGVVRPRRGHLWLGRNIDNINDKMAKGRAPVGELSGARKHPERVARGDRHGFRLHPERVPRGSHHGVAKLSESVVLAIRQRYGTRDWLTYQSIALHFGVSESLIGQIVRRDIWRHLP